ncbi:MAG: family 1 glycosylhydrolase [Deltaproteobacteria bacterium]|nr:family 1 glycosylhydrolase [Deltaproteobacteria bacterium]
MTRRLGFHRAPVAALFLPLLGALAGCGGAGKGGVDSAIPDGATPDSGADDGGLADGGPDGGPDSGDLAFPEGFLWGTAVAGFQVDPGCPTLASELCEDRGSDWYQWVTDPKLVAEKGNHLSGEPIAHGPGHYEVFAEDFALARDTLENNALRFSLEWSRLFPTSTAAATTDEEVAALTDPAYVAHVHEVLAALAAHGLKPLVTLHHYTLPLWLHDGKACHAKPATCSPAGWLDAQALIREMAKYARFVAREFGAEVDLWATLNEPLAVVIAGFLFPSADRTNPPGLSLDADRAVAALLAMIEAHAWIYDAIHEADTVDADGDGAAALVGLVHAVSVFSPKNPANSADVTGAKHAFRLYNRVILDGTILGDLDTNLDGVIEEHRDDLAGRMDFLGVNYYFRTTVKGTVIPVFLKYALLDFVPVSFATDPGGMREAVLFAAGYGLPVYITECGVDDPKGDGTGPRFLVRHLAALHEAMEEGADVRGYFHWSLMDNYEWNHGTSLRFGLFAVDPLDPSKARAPKLSASVYGRIAGADAIPAALLDAYGAR